MPEVSQIQRITTYDPMTPTWDGKRGQIYFFFQKIDLSPFPIPRAARISRVPFTISHAAAALPLRRFGKFRLPLAALMIGSMSPDYAYFLPLGFDRVETHSIAGLFIFCWPASLGLWLLFVRVLEPPTMTLLPENWRSRFPSSSPEITLRVLGLASVAVLLGALTHLVWDAFTHGRTVVTQAIPALKSVAFHIDGRRIRWFFLLQLLSSVFGILALALWAWRQPPGRYPRPQPKTPLSNGMRLRAVLAIIGLSSALAMAGYLANSELHFRGRVFHLLVGGMTGLVLAWCAIAVVIRRRSNAG